MIVTILGMDYEIIFEWHSCFRFPISSPHCSFGDASQSYSRRAAAPADISGPVYNLAIVGRGPEYQRGRGGCIVDLFRQGDSVQRREYGLSCESCKTLR